MPSLVAKETDPVRSRKRLPGQLHSDRRPPAPPAAQRADPSDRRPAGSHPDAEAPDGVRRPVRESFLIVLLRALSAWGV